MRPELTLQDGETGEGKGGGRRQEGMIMGREVARR